MKKIYSDINKISGKEIEIISSVIKAGKVAIIPTDTIYGLSVLAGNKESVDKIYSIKKRVKDKPLVLLMKNFSMIEKYCYLNKHQYSYIKKEINKEKPVTFILKNKNKEFKHLTNIKGGLSVRIPFGSLFLMKLMKKINEPVVSTSLNVSGEHAILNLKNLSDKINTEKIDFSLDVGRIRRSKVSKVVDITDMNNIKIIRR